MVLASLIMANCSMARVENFSTSRSRSVGLLDAREGGLSLFFGRLVAGEPAAPPFSVDGSSFSR
jgi:hypothetical protein